MSNPIVDDLVERVVDWPGGTSLSISIGDGRCIGDRRHSSAVARDALGGLVFHPAEAPTAANLDVIVARTARRSIAWLRKRGYIDDTPFWSALERGARADGARVIV